MSNEIKRHRYVERKETTLDLYKQLGIKVPLIPREIQYGWRQQGLSRDTLIFQPTESDMKRRLTYLLDHLSSEIKKTI